MWEKQKLPLIYTNIRSKRTKTDKSPLQTILSVKDTFINKHSSSPTDMMDVHGVRSSDGTDGAASSHVAWRASRQQDRRPGSSGTSCPHPVLTHSSTLLPCLSLPPPPYSPSASPTASQRAGQQPSEDDRRMSSDGQAVFGVNLRSVVWSCWRESTV